MFLRHSTNAYFEAFVDSDLTNSIIPFSVLGPNRNGVIKSLEIISLLSISFNSAVCSLPALTVCNGGDIRTSFSIEGSSLKYDCGL